VQDLQIVRPALILISPLIFQHSKWMLSHVHFILITFVHSVDFTLSLLCVTMNPVFPLQRAHPSSFLLWLFCLFLTVEWVYVFVLCVVAISFFPFIDSVLVLLMQYTLFCASILIHLPINGCIVVGWRVNMNRLATLFNMNINIKTMSLPRYAQIYFFWH
jgi:hypothetical protein